jgi:DNA-binding HxlR family transcriptional regulator
MVDFTPNVYSPLCPTRKVLDLIADKWTVLVMGLLKHGPHRFSAILRQVEGVSQKVLTQTLREMERNGLVTRTVYAEVPPRVEYELSPLGRTLTEPLYAITRWAEAHISAVMAAQLEFDARTEKR